MITTLHNPANAVVIGASGGIGSAMTEHLCGLEPVQQVFAFSRHGDGVTHEKVTHGRLDLLNEESIEQAASLVKSQPIDLVFVATGVLQTEAFSPEKSMRQWNSQTLSAVFRTNTIGPAIVAKHFLPLLRRGEKSVFAAISARVGSTADNRLGGWASYRASKAALNSILRTASIEHRRRWPLSIVVALHPGTVDTPLSKPFSGRVKPEQLFTSEQSVDYMLRVIDGLTVEDSGGFFAWDNSPIEF